MDGQRIMVTRANPKKRVRADGEQEDQPTTPADSASSGAAPKRVREKKPKGPKREVSEWRQRTLVVWGLSAGTADRVLRVRARKSGKVERLRVGLKAPGVAIAPVAATAVHDPHTSVSSKTPAPGLSSSTPSAVTTEAEEKSGALSGRVVAHVTMASLEEASKALGALDGKSVKGIKLQARRLSQLLPAAVARRRGRVIVRNLPFQVSEAEIWELLSLAGPLASVHVPTVTVRGSGRVTHDEDDEDEEDDGEDGEEKGEDAHGGKRVGRGFAFGQFVTREDAVRAVQWSGAGKTKLRGRAVVIDFASDKVVYEANMKARDVAAAAAAEAEGGDKQAAVGGQGKEDAEEGSSDTDTTSSDDDDGSSTEEDDSEDDGSEDTEDEQVEDEDVEDGGESTQESEQAKLPAAAAASPAPARDVSEGRTLFVRNVPFDAAGPDVRAAFARFGDVEFAATVKDRVTNTGKGTAFVKFVSAESAQAALRACELAEESASASSSRSKASLEATASLATAATASAVFMAGRRLIVKLAVDREEATALRADRSVATDAEGRRWDKRHLYLAKEGALLGDALAALPALDRQKRERAASEKKAKLKSPMFFVSPTRLSIRNLGKAVDEPALRKLCQESAAEGIKAGLVVKGEGDPSLRPATGTKPRVVVSKVILFRETSLERAMKKGKAAVRAAKEAEKAARKRGNKGAAAKGGAGSAADVAGGGEGVPEGEEETEGSAAAAAAPAAVLGASKGFAFVEFTEHVHALACLRRLNNNPAFAWAAVGGRAAMSREPDLRARLLVEFAIENANKLRIKAQRAVAAERKRGAATKIHGSSEAAAEALQARQGADRAAAASSKAGEAQAWAEWSRHSTAGGSQGVARSRRGVAGADRDGEEGGSAGAEPTGAARRVARKQEKRMARAAGEAAGSQGAGASGPDAAAKPNRKERRKHAPKRRLKGEAKEEAATDSLEANYLAKLAQ